MRRLAPVLGLLLLPSLVRAQEPTTPLPPAPAAAPVSVQDSSAAGARDGRAAARGHGHAHLSFPAALLLGFWAGRTTPPWMSLPSSGVAYAGGAGIGVLAGAAATGSQGERNFLDEDSARIAPRSASYRYAYEDAYRAQFAAERRRDLWVSGLLFVTSGLVVMALRQ